MSSFTLSIFATLALALVIGQGEGVSITSIRVPPAVESGSESVVLDCEYVLAPHEKQGLVVQWFFRDSAVPVYQWIPGKRPQVSGALKGRINLEHRASDDPHHRHRALEIVKATTDIGGDYRCKVASFDNEDSQTARMAVYIPAEKFTIEQEAVDSALVNVTCQVEGVYPKPQMALYQQSGSHGTRSQVDGAELEVEARDGGVYDAVLYKLIDEQDLSADTIFECQLVLPDTDYQLIQRLNFQPSIKVASSALPNNDISEDDGEIDGGDDVDVDGGHLASAVTSAPSPSSIGHRFHANHDDSQVLHDVPDGAAQSATGRGIRAHDAITESNSGSVFSGPWISLLMGITCVVINLS